MPDRSLNKQTLLFMSRKPKFKLANVANSLIQRLNEAKKETSGKKKFGVFQLKKSHNVNLVFTMFALHNIFV